MNMVKPSSRYLLLYVAITAICAACVWSCGRGNGSEPPTPELLTADELNACSAAVRVVNTEVQRNMRNLAGDETAVPGTYDFAAETACVNGGRIMSTGNLTLSRTDAITAVGAQVSVALSDAQDPANDCTCEDIIMTGTLALTAAGSEAQINSTVAGTITVERKIDESNIVLVTDDCAIDMNFDNSASGGTFCGQTVP